MRYEIAALRMGIARNLNELQVDAPRTPLGTQPLFDVDGADLFTQWLLLRVLMEAAPSPKLPYYLHGQVALVPMMGRRATLRQ